MRPKVVILAALLPLLVGGCTRTTPPERICMVVAECRPPPEQTHETLTLPFPVDGPYREPRAETEVDDYRSDDCDERCALKRARRDEERRRAIRDYDERMYRGWIPADDPRRWR